MFDVILEKIKEIVKSRLFPVTLIYLVLFFVLIQRIFYLQIVTGEETQAEIEKRTTTDRDIKSTRANIYDCNGKLLAYNELSYSVTFEDTGELTENKEKNEMIHMLIQTIEANNGKLSITFGLKLDNDGKVVFNLDGSVLERFKKDIYSAKELSATQKAATAEMVYTYLLTDTSSTSPSFEIGSNYTKEEAIKIMAIRYSMFLNQWTKYKPITIATNVSEATVAALKENKALLPGVDILQETQRKYNESIYLSNIIGYTGTINDDEKAALKEQNKSENYAEDDQIGKMGIEKEYEDYLHGVKGTENLMINENSGRVIDVTSRVEPTAGQDIYLTIDSELQKSCYKLLEKRLASILIYNIKNTTTPVDKQIPINDVYFALINNNIIDITSFHDAKATDLEKAVLKDFTNTQKDVLSELDNLLAVSSKTLNTSVSDDLEEYLIYVYSILKNDGALIKDSIDTKDSTYQKYANNTISLSEFLQYAISKNWIDLTKLNIKDEYYSSEELYKKLVNYTKKLLKDDSTFNKKIYKTLVISQKLSGKEICLLLFDQGVLKYDEDAVSGLEGGSVSPYSFIIKKIKNLEITPAQLALDPCSGSIVVTDTKTGEVRALVSYPSYDNNKLANTIDQDYYTQVFSDLSLPMRNRPSLQKTAPGSTYKMLVAVTAIEENKVNTTEKIKDEGVFKNITPSPRCWIYSSSHSTHGKVDVAGALEVSCNYFFYEMGFRLSKDSSDKYISNLGLKKIATYAKEFGFDATSGIELPESAPEISDNNAIASAIGQGTNNYTPSQLSKYVTTLANDGICYDLSIVDKITDANGTTIQDNTSTVHNTVSIQDSTWNAIHDGMYRVVNAEKSKLKTLFKDIDKIVVGKTGTAQENKLKPDHSLFVSYAPYDDPEISVTSVIPNGYTSSNAVELSRDVYQYYFYPDKRETLLKKEVTTPELSHTSLD